MAKSPINQFNSLRGPVIDRGGTGFLKIGDHIDLIHESIVRLIFTRKGTRMGNLDFGTNIPDLPFTDDWEGIQNKIEFGISEALARWEPRIQYQGMELVALDQGSVTFSITFIELVTGTEQKLPVVADFV